MAKNIYDNFLPGPITVVSKGKNKLARGIQSSRGTQGIRVSSHPFVQAWLKHLKRPVTATSANASYKKVPYTIADVLNNLSTRQKNLLGLIIDAGRLPKRKPSTVVDTTLDNIYVVRQGAIKLTNPSVFKANSLEDTQHFVEKLYDGLKQYWGKKEIVFLLQGELGAGKTHFTKFLAAKLGIKDMVVSPTFTLCNEYETRLLRRKLMLYHIDTYRMYHATEIDDLRPLEIFRKPNVVVVEWANKIYQHIQQYLKGAVVVEILITAPSPTKRVFEYTIKK